MTTSNKKPSPDDDIISALGSTFGSFESRLQKKLQEQAEEAGRTTQASAVKNTRILQALNTIRKALTETQNIKLGQRFFLELEVSDWNGWPKLELNLVDKLVPDVFEQALIVAVHEKMDVGIVEFKNKVGMLLGDLPLTADQELTRIPLVLKKSVRAFLDQVAEYVINPIAPEELIKSKTVADEPEATTSSEELKSTNLFMDSEYDVDENRVEVSDTDTKIDL